MATNRKYSQSNRVTPAVVAQAQTASRTSNKPVSGDPCVVGQLPGVALNSADAAGKVVMQLDGIFTLLVSGIDSSGTSGADANVAVNGGDLIYFDKAKTPPLSKRAGGIRFGYAFGAAGVELVASGATTTAISVQVGH